MKKKFNGTEGQDRESYTDTQDRKNYTVDPKLEEIDRRLEIWMESEEIKQEMRRTRNGED